MLAGSLVAVSGTAPVGRGDVKEQTLDAFRTALAGVEHFGGSVADVVRTLVYRSELFGRPFSDAMQRVMRGPSDWSVGERELFAAFVSAQNQCPF